MHKFGPGVRYLEKNRSPGWGIWKKSCPTPGEFKCARGGGGCRKELNDPLHPMEKFFFFECSNISPFFAKSPPGTDFFRMPDPRGPFFPNSPGLPGRGGCRQN